VVIKSHLNPDDVISGDRERELVSRGIGVEGMDNMLLVGRKMHGKRFMKCF
jgi:hypothetical protein